MQLTLNPRCSFALAMTLALSTSQCFAADLDFEKEIAPILQERCWGCHGADVAESGLRLDQRPRMLRGGDSGLSAVVPGHPEKSYLVEVINHADKDTAMPPDEEKLPAEQIELLTKWIQEGANWPGQMDAALKESTDHWAFQPVTRPPIPGESTSGAGAQKAVDAFLLDRLSRDKLTFSEPAHPTSLIRRVTIVLTGLMPTPEDTAEFLAACETDPDKAYEAVVDKLLASQHFGERWAQHWLDVIRWAETNGSEANLYRRNSWVYRDYVVRSFNEDKPYDQFVREQIAGDSTGSGEATGFLVAGPHVPAATVGREPSAIRQARADRMDEIMQTVGASVMGVTIGCARCHNHKFDPITIKDYYSMTAAFQDIEFGGRQPEFSVEHPRRRRGAELWKQVAQERDKLREFGGWEENWGAYRELHFIPITTRGVRIRFRMQNVGVDEIEVLGPRHQTLTQAAAQSSLRNTEPRDSSSGLDSQLRNWALASLGTRVSGYPDKGVENRNPIDRVNDGEFGTMTWRAQKQKDGDEQPYVQFEFEQPQEIDRLRLSNNREYFYDTDYLKKKPGLPRYEFDMDVLQDDGEWEPWVGTWHVNQELSKSRPEREAILKTVQRLIEQLAEEGPQPSFVGRFVPLDVTYVLHRGSPENPRDEVMPAAPAILDGDLDLTSLASGVQRRSAFAKWITGFDNPLTCRVIVNRIWHHVFGSGIVTTTSDFGKAGAPPTHPELLDWLAAEFREPTGMIASVASVSNQESQSAISYSSVLRKPYSLKSMIRLLVMSQAFRQSSLPRADAVAIDAGSALLWRFPPRRVEAEVIRDSVLQVSGCLDRTIGGRSFRIHDEKDTYAQWQVVDNHGPATWRRMLYQERMRRVDDHLFTAFDFPDCGQVRAKRPTSTTPLQALNLLNSEFVLDQSQRIADRAIREADGDKVRAISRCFELLLNRTPTADEHAAGLTLAKENSLALVCRALINSNEFAFIP